MNADVLGRGTEQSRLIELLDRARTGSGGAVLVVGMPGVGKHELLAGARRRAGESFTVLSVIGTEAESEHPFAGLIKAIDPLIGWLDELPPARADALRDPREADPLDVYLATYDLLTAAARERPILVLADEMQWLDDESRNFILFLARRITTAPIAVLAASQGEMLELESRRRRAPRAWDSLTAAEQRVAQLIIDGATYRETAQELFLSVRTVESHLRQVYRKLGLRSRTELTRALSREPPDG